MRVVIVGEQIAGLCSILDKPMGRATSLHNVSIDS